MMIRNAMAALLLTVFSVAALAADPVNINTASADELTALDNVGASRAQAIVEYREHEGDFPSVSALVNVSGIGPATLEQNRDRLHGLSQTMNARAGRAHRPRPRPHGSPQFPLRDALIRGPSQPGRPCSAARLA